MTLSAFEHANDQDCARNAMADPSEALHGLEIPHTFDAKPHPDPETCFVLGQRDCVNA
jgi:hypothetical protein